MAFPCPSTRSVTYCSAEGSACQRARNRGRATARAAASHADAHGAPPASAASTSSKIGGGKVSGTTNGHAVPLKFNQSFLPTLPSGAAKKGGLLTGSKAPANGAKAGNGNAAKSGTSSSATAPSRSAKGGVASPASVPTAAAQHGGRAGSAGAKTATQCLYGCRSITKSQITAPGLIVGKGQFSGQAPPAARPSGHGAGAAPRLGSAKTPAPTAGHQLSITSGYGPYPREAAACHPSAGTRWPRRVRASRRLRWRRVQPNAGLCTARRERDESWRCRSRHPLFHAKLRALGRAHYDIPYTGDAAGTAAYYRHHLPSTYGAGRYVWSERQAFVLLGGPGRVGGDSRKRWRVEHLVALVLQLAVAAMLVLALARPSGLAGTASTRVYVLDAGILMTATDSAPSRMAVAQSAEIAHDIESAPAGTTFTIVAAGAGQPQVVVSTTGSGDRRSNACTPSFPSPRCLICRAP